MKIMGALHADEHALQNIQEIRESQSGQTSRQQASATGNDPYPMANVQS